jgi:hypothetical protein
VVARPAVGAESDHRFRPSMCLSRACLDKSSHSKLAMKTQIE